MFSVSVLATGLTFLVMLLLPRPFFEQPVPSPAPRPGVVITTCEYLDGAPERFEVNPEPCVRGGDHVPLRPQ